MSPVAASEDDTSDQNGKPSTPSHPTLSTSTIITPRQNLHLAINTWDVLPASRPTISSWFQQNCIFSSSFLLFSVWICPNTLRFYISLFAIYSSQCARKGSAEQFTDPFLVAWPAHNLLLHYLPHHLPFCFGLNRHCVFASSLFTVLSFNKPIHVPVPWFICHFSVPVCYCRLSRAIYSHNFSHPAGAHFAHCNTCLATSHFVFVSVWAHNFLSASSLFLHRNTFLSQ